MRDCVFLVADKNMEATFVGFLTRDRFYESLGIRPFDFDADRDIIVDTGGNDPGIYNRGPELIRPYQQEYHYAVIVLDNDWSGSPGVDAIERHITENMLKTGWNWENFVVIVIDPELEVWILQDNQNVKDACRFKEDISLREWLTSRQLWDANTPKSKDPKQAIETILKTSKTPRSANIYKQIASKVSVKKCIDPAFQKLCSQLQVWFPPDRV